MWRIVLPAEETLAFQEVRSSQQCWDSRFLEPVPGPLIQEQINLCEKN